MSRWKWLIDNAKLDIYEFSVDRREQFSVEDRLFPFYVMSYVKEGSARAIISGETYNTPAGHLLLIPSFARHSHYIPEGCGPTTFLWWHFNISVSGLDLMKLIDYPIVLPIRDYSTFESIFYAYMELCGRKPSLPGIIYRQAKAYEIMAFLFESISEDSEISPGRLDSIPEAFFEMMKEIVEYPTRNLSLDDLAKRYYMNPTYISNQFKKLFGISPIRLRDQVFIARAKTILRENETMSVNALAENLGFFDISAFTHFFTRHTGCSPTEYRKKYY